jgi:hypothetical protein
MSFLLGCPSPRPSRSRWRSTGRRRSTAHPPGPERSGGLRRSDFLASRGMGEPMSPAHSFLRGGASPGEESRATAIAARRSRRQPSCGQITPSKRPLGSRAKRPSREKRWRTWGRARGGVHRAKERKPWRMERRHRTPGPQPGGQCSRRRLSVVGIGALQSQRRGNSAVHDELDGCTCRTPDRRHDEARLQRALAANAAGKRRPQSHAIARPERSGGSGCAMRTQTERIKPNR